MIFTIKVEDKMKIGNKQLIVGAVIMATFTSIALAQPNLSKKPLPSDKVALQKQIERQQDKAKQQALKLLRQQELARIEQEILALEKQKLAIMQQPIVPKMPKVQYQWEKGALGKVPASSVVAWQNIAGHVQICQSEYNGGIHPGQLTKQGCRITYEGSAFIQNQYNILTSKTEISWRPPQASYQYHTQSQWPRYAGVGPVIIGSEHQALPLSQPVIGGHEEGHDLFICRGMYNDNVYVGKVVASNCNIGFNGQEIKLPVYEVLFQNVVAEN